MTATLYGIRNCDTVRKARAFLDGQGEAYRFHDFKSEGVAEDQLSRWCDRVGWSRVLNRAGTTFRKLAEADRAALDRDRAIQLMLAQPSMIKRPVLERGEVLLLGFRPEEYEAVLG